MKTDDQITKKDILKVLGVIGLILLYPVMLIISIFKVVYYENWDMLIVVCICGGVGLFTIIVSVAMERGMKNW